MKGYSLTKGARKARKAAARKRWIGCPSPQRNKKVAAGAMPSSVIRKQLRVKV